MKGRYYIILVLYTLFVILAATEIVEAIFACLILACSIPLILSGIKELRKFAKEIRTQGKDALRLNAEIPKQTLQYLASGVAITLASLTLRLALLFPTKGIFLSPVFAIIVTLTSIITVIHERRSI